MIFDLHNDVVTALSGSERRKVLRGFAECGYRTILAIWVTGLPSDGRGKKSILSYRCGFPIGIEDLGSLTVRDVGALLDELSPAYASLTWNGENALAGGCGAEMPLTLRGRRAISLLSNRGVALDLAHLSDCSFYGAMDEAARRGCRILCSHTASRELSDHPRCITDDQAKLIARAGGIIGVAAVPNFLDASLSYGENCGRETYVKHIAHFCALIGADHVAIGSDLYGAEYYPEGLTDISGFLTLGDDLEKAGLSHEEAEAVMHVNAEKFFRMESEI